MRLRFLLPLICLVLGCKNGAAPATRQSTVPEVPSVSTASAVTNSVLGTWICIADNGGGGMGAEMTFHENGVADFRLNGESHKRNFKREAGSDWVRRKQLFSLEYEDNEQWRALARPGVELVYFQEGGQSGPYVDWGSNLLYFEPTIPMLYNPITQAWCRPGDESRVKKILEEG